MTFKHEKISRINWFIKQRATGNRKQFAAKLAVSPSGLDRCLKFMKEQGAPIKYDFIAGTYYYEEAGSFEIGFKAEADAYKPVLHIL